MITNRRYNLVVALLVPLLFTLALASLLFRTGGPAPPPRARPPLPTPVVLDRLVPMPREPMTSKSEPVSRGDGLRAW